LAFVDNDGIRIYCEVVGTGPALLFTHGFAATSAMFAPQRDALAATHTVVTWDMRGHGKTDYPADQDAYSQGRVLGDMRALLDGHDIERAVLVGHSVGGYLTLRFRLCDPDRVNGLVLIGTAPGFRRDDRRAEWNRYCERRAVELEQRGLDVLSRSPEVLAAKHRGAEGLARAAQGFLAQSDSAVIDSLSSIDVPTLLVAGARDVVDGYDYVAPTRYMARKIPDAQFVCFEHSAHAPGLTEPDAFNARLQAFLEGVER
jgi:pimeloyl-ACP methyl ester carboxylesterase